MESPLSSLGTAAVVLIVVLVLVALLLLISLVRKHRKVHRPDTPVPTKVAYWVSLVYTVFPIDALPDPIYADDIVVWPVVSSSSAGHSGGRRATMSSADRPHRDDLAAHAAAVAPWEGPPRRRAHLPDRSASQVREPTTPSASRPREVW